MQRIWLGLAGMFGAVSVAADAAARHLLAGDAYRLDLAATAARYGLIHAAALVGLALLLDRNGAARGLGRCALFAAGWCVSLGLFLFCGSLLLLAAGAPAGLAAGAPFGGTLFIVGWAALLLHALSPRAAA